MSIHDRVQPIGICAVRDQFTPIFLCTLVGGGGGGGGGATAKPPYSTLGHTSRRPCAMPTLGNKVESGLFKVSRTVHPYFSDSTYNTQC